MRGQWRIQLWVLLAAMLIGSGGVSAADWTQLGCDAARTSRTADEPKGPFEVAWVFDGVWPQDRLLATVQVVTWQGKGFVGSKRGTMYAINLADGTLAWRYDSGRAIEQTAASIDGKVVFGNMAGHIIALDAASGKPAWQVDLQSRGITNAPLIYDGRIFIGTRGGTMARLNPANGSVLWRTDVGSPIMQSAAASDGRIFIMPEDKRLRCLDAASGALLWTADRPIVVSTLRGTHSVYADGVVYIGGASKYNADHYRADGQPAVRMPPDLPMPDRKTAEVVPASSLPPAYLAWLNEYDAHLSKTAGTSTLHGWDAASGRPLPGLAMTGQQSMACPLQAPAVTAQGLLVFPQSAGGWSADLGVWHPPSRQLRQILVHKTHVNNDETQNLSVGGNTVFTVHTWEGHPGVMEAFDLTTNRRLAIPGASPRVHGEWKAAPPGNAASICGDLFFHVAGDRVAAWRGSRGAAR